MSTATKSFHADTSNVLHSLADIAAFVPMLFISLAKAITAAHAADRLYHLSDKELAARGLSRMALGKHICDTYLAD